MAHRPVIPKRPGGDKKRAKPASTTSFDPQTKDPDTFSFAALEFICAGVSFLGALVVYAWTLAPTVTLVDSGELIVAAHDLGVAHPPGFPLWVMLAHLASLLPLGSIAVGINFSSALFAALASAMMTLVVAELILIASHLATAKKKNAQRGRHGPNSGLGRLSIFGPALGAGLLMAFSRTLWFYATITEVYALNTLLILLIFFLMARWRRRIVTERAGTGAAVTRHDGWLYAAAALFGLALGDHHVTTGLTLPAVAVTVYRTQGLKFFTSRRLVYAALISISALIAVYCYLPIAASHSPAINWGDPRSLQEIWWHITGRQYRVFLHFSPGIMGEQFIEFCTMVVREFSVAWLPLALLLALTGIASVSKLDRTTFWFLLVVAIANLAYDLSYEISEDKDAYYLPVFISIAIAAGFGIHWLIQTAVFKLSPRRAYWVAAAAVIITSTTALAANWPYNNRRHYFIAHDYVENLFSTIEPGGLLLTLDWQVASPMFYAQEIEHRRRDAKIVDVNLLRRSWYFDYLRRAHPDLVERSRQQIDRFVEKLKEWERDPAAFNRNEALNQRINDAFEEMLRSIVTNENKIAPVYITQELLFEPSANTLANWLRRNYQLVPQGLVFNLASDSSFHDPGDWHLQTRGLADGTVRFEKDDVVSLKVLPAYASMLVNRGLYFESFNKHERAISALKQALALDPGFSPAQRGLAEITAKSGNP